MAATITVSMQFAVIEYSSKTGDVWKHTDARPNYLADPHKEIDPTSFGCYVSALKGEHVPLTGLIIGRVSRTQPQTKLWRRFYKRLRGTWPIDYSLDYLKSFTTLMVVHQLSDAGDIVNFLKKLRQLPHPPFVMGVPTQPFGNLKQALEQDATAHHNFVEYMDACDVMLTVVQDTLPWYQALTQTPVIYMPQPYPASYAQRYFKSQSEKKRIIFVAGVTQRATIRKGHEVAKLLQQQHPEYEIQVPKLPKAEYDTSALAGSRFKVIPFEEWREHLATLARVAIVINTDYTSTRGRVQTDCAAVGTPSLGANSDGQRDLFPDLTSGSETPVATLVNLGNRLLTDTKYYQTIVTQAAERLLKYDYGESADRIRLLDKTYQVNKEQL